MAERSEWSVESLKELAAFVARPLADGEEPSDEAREAIFRFVREAAERQDTDLLVETYRGRYESSGNSTARRCASRAAPDAALPPLA